MELRDALGQISEIRLQIARSGRFRGYRSAPVAATGLVALITGVSQALLVPSPLDNLTDYLVLWVSAACAGLLITLGDVWRRNRQSQGMLQKEATRFAIEQFMPCVLAGGLVTLIISLRAPALAWLLPGFWAILFSLGLFASFRLLPGGILGVAVFYLLAGCGYLWLISPEKALSPWSMVLLFGVGQFATASVLLASEMKQE